MDNQKSVKVSCEMIISDGNKILLGKRGNVFGKGTWALPGGHLEFNEKAEDCVIRELDEEIGIKPVEMKLIGVVNDLPDLLGQENHYVRLIYLISKFSGEIKNREPDKCEGWEWFDKGKMPEPPFVGHVKVLDLFLNNKGEFFRE